MVNMREGGHISEHDYLIGSKVATVMCGGEVEAGSLVDEQWFLDLERKAFMELIATEKTPGADRAHAQDRQAAEELTRHAYPAQRDRSICNNPGCLHRRRDAHARRQGAARHVQERRAPTTCSRTC